MPRSSFVFYFPYHGFGGVPVLFLRLAEKLALLNHLVTVIDYADGYMAKNKSDLIQLIEFTENQALKIPPQSNLILQSVLPWGIPQNLICDAQTKIFFWTCYPFNFIPVLPGQLGAFIQAKPFLLKLLLFTLLNSAREKVKKLVEYLQAQKAVVYMDLTNLETTQSTLGLPQFKPVFLPIPVNANHSYWPQPKHEILQLAWLGRIADFKIHSILRILKDLKQCASNFHQKIHLTIIGSGEYEQTLWAELQTTSTFTYEMIESIPQADLHHFLNTKIDLLFAMGTSALEGGLAAIPTVLMNFSYSKISSSYRYQFLQDTKNFNLGELITSKNIMSGYELIEILKKVSNEKQNLAEKVQKYVLQNHSLNQVTDSFLNLTETNKLTYQNLLIDISLSKPKFYKIWAFIKKFKP